MLHVIPLASTALTVVRGRALDSRRRTLQRTAEVQALRDEVALLREELRLEDARTARLSSSRRPCDRCRWEHGGPEVDQARRLKEFGKENARLKMVVADLTLDAAIPREAASRDS